MPIETRFRSVEESLKRLQRRTFELFAVLIVVCLVPGVWGLITAVDSQNKLSRDEKATCQVQARGLPAFRQLSMVMDDIDKLLRTPPSPGAPPVPPATKVIVDDLRVHLDKYNYYQARQPATRKC